MANFALLAKLGLDSSGLSKGLKQSEQKVNKFKDSARNAFLKVAGGIAAVGLGKKIMKLAVDAEETADMFNTILGSAAENVNNKITELQKTIPATREQFQKSIGTIASMGQAFGMADEAAATFAIGITKMSADIASARNMRPEEMFTKMAAAITGEFEPLKRLGIAINMATVEQEAMTLGLIKSKSELTAQSKAVAVQNIVLKQMGKMLGNAAQTQGSAANQTKFLKARIEQLGTELGQKLRPILMKSLVFLNRFADFFEKNKNLVGSFTKRLITYIAAKKALSMAIPIVNGALAAYKVAAAGATVGTTRLVIAMTALKLKIQGLLATTGIGLLVVVLGELGVAAINAATAVDDTTDQIGNTMADIEADIADTVAAVEKATNAAMAAADANQQLAKSSMTLQERLEGEERILKMIADRKKENAKRTQDLIDKKNQEAIKTKELEALQARAKGLHTQADAIERQIELMKKAIEFSKKYGMSLMEAFNLAKAIQENQPKPENIKTTMDGRAAGGISSMAAIGGGGMTGALKPIEKANEIAEKQLEKLDQIAENTQPETEPNFS